MKAQHGEQMRRLAEEIDLEKPRSSFYRLGGRYGGETPVEGGSVRLAPGRRPSASLLGVLLQAKLHE
jgi:hypothetical protein